MFLLILVFYFFCMKGFSDISALMTNTILLEYRFSCICNKKNGKIYQTYQRIAPNKLSMNLSRIQYHRMEFNNFASSSFLWSNISERNSLVHLFINFTSFVDCFLPFLTQFTTFRISHFPPFLSFLSSLANLVFF